MQQFLAAIDREIAHFEARIVEEIKIPQTRARAVATTVFEEVRAIKDELFLRKLKDASPLSVRHRLFLYEGYQIWERAIAPTMACPTSSSSLPPERVGNAFHEMRAIIQMYMSFVFAGDGLFEKLAKDGPTETRKCAKYVRKNPMRALRNAVAHGNWHLVHPDSVRYWARKGGGIDPCPSCGRAQKEEPLAEFTASGDDMNFYLALTKGVCWAALLALDEHVDGSSDGLSYV